MLIPSPSKIKKAIVRSGDASWISSSDSLLARVELVLSNFDFSVFPDADSFGSSPEFYRRSFSSSISLSDFLSSIDLISEGEITVSSLVVSSFNYPSIILDSASFVAFS